MYLPSDRPAVTLAVSSSDFNRVIICLNSLLQSRSADNSRYMTPSAVPVVLTAAAELRLRVLPHGAVSLPTPSQLATTGSPPPAVAGQLCMFVLLGSCCCPCSVKLQL